VLALALLVALPATGQARMSRLPGTGLAPGVAIAANGVATVGWYQQKDGYDTLAVCRIRRGSRKCSGPPAILDATPGLKVGPQPVLLRIEGADVRLVAARMEIDSYHSPDRGVTWSQPIPIAAHPYLTGAIGPAGTVVLGENSNVVATNVGGPLQSRVAPLTPGFEQSQTLEFVGALPFFIAGGRSPTSGFRAWTGAGDIADPATWTPLRQGPAMTFYDLADGPRGLWLVHERVHGVGDDVVVQHWRNGRFGPMRRIPGSAGSILGATIAQDSAGRLAVGWYDGRGRGSIKVSATRNGKTWSKARKLGRSGDFPAVMAMALGADGRGVLVADQGSRMRPVLVGKLDVRSLTRKARRRR
jgi:hypothetical protein